MPSKQISNSAWQQRWPAPAKINRFLHIIGRRKDGYHLLQSVFQFVDFCDYLIFSAEKSNRIQLKNSIDSVADDDNLVIKAAKLLQPFSPNKQGVSIQLEKNIPMGAGLGGGSSDAATSLLVLNKLWNCGLSIQQLASLGAQLGADVPFFIHGENAFVEGVGEQITPLAIDCPWLLLAIPPCHVATAEVFSESKLPRNTKPIELTELTQNKTAKTALELADFGHNDCQKIVTDNYPQIKNLLNCLQGASNPRLTGTGSCVFSTFNTEDAAATIATTCPSEVKTVICKALQNSPLHPLLDTAK